MSYLALIEENPQFICFATGHMWRFVLPLQKPEVPTLFSEQIGPKQQKQS